MADVNDYILSLIDEETILENLYIDKDYLSVSNILYSVFSDREKFKKIHRYALKYKSLINFVYIRTRLYKQTEIIYKKYENDVYYVDRLKDKLYVVYLPKKCKDFLKYCDINEINQFINNPNVQILEKRIHKDYGIGLVIHTKTDDTVKQYDLIRFFIYTLELYLKTMHNIKTSRMFIYLFDRFKYL